MAEKCSPTPLRRLNRRARSTGRVTQKRAHHKCKLASPAELCRAVSATAPPTTAAEAESSAGFDKHSAAPTP